jgi:hypothetical protein
MSIKLMTMVWDRYPVGGNEMALALVLADHAHDDGSRIWPGLASMAQKTRTSRATVQRMLAHMQARGWLELVRPASGRQGDTNEYRIAAAWIAGGALGKPCLNLRPPEEGPTPVDNCPSEAPDHVSKDSEPCLKNEEPCVTAVIPESPEPPKKPYPLTPVAQGCGQVEAEKSDSQTAVTTKGERKPRWRWTGKRRDVEAEAKRHGIGPWDEQAFHRGQGESFAAYRARVEAAVAAKGGPPK